MSCCPSTHCASNIWPRLQQSQHTTINEARAQPARNACVPEGGEHGLRVDDSVPDQVPGHPGLGRQREARHI